MNKIITLEELSEIKNDLGKGVQVLFCSSEKDGFEVIRRENFTSFEAIKDELVNRRRYKVFRIDTLNDIICVYVVCGYYY